jgi:hypothetical protein
MSKYLRFLPYLSLWLMLLFLSACREATPVCLPPDSTPVYITMPPSLLPTPTPSEGKFQVLINRQEIAMDKLVEGALCNDHWSGSVYVSCDVQVYAWQEQPDFLKDCQLEIEPNTVVYVAYHNNTAYYNGCSCHTGATPQP